MGTAFDHGWAELASNDRSSVCRRNERLDRYVASRFVEDGLDLGGYFTNDWEPSGRGDGSSALHRGQGIPGPAQGVMWPATTLSDSRRCRRNRVRAGKRERA